MNIYETVKNLRMALCLEQKELAELIGVNRSSICNYENGRRKPRLPVVRKMLELAKKHKLKFTLDDFVDE